MLPVNCALLSASLAETALCRHSHSSQRRGTLCCRGTGMLLHCLTTHRSLASGFGLLLWHALLASTRFRAGVAPCTALCTTDSDIYKQLHPQPTAKQQPTRHRPWCGMVKSTSLALTYPQQLGTDHSLTFTAHTSCAHRLHAHWLTSGNPAATAAIAARKYSMAGRHENPQQLQTRTGPSCYPLHTQLACPAAPPPCSSHTPHLQHCHQYPFPASGHNHNHDLPLGF